VEIIFFDLSILQKQAEAGAVRAGVVAGDGEIFSAFAAHGVDEVLRDAAEAEAADQNGGAVSKFCDGGVGGGYAFIHESYFCGRRALPGGRVYCKQKRGCRACAAAETWGSGACRYVGCGALPLCTMHEAEAPRVEIALLGEMEVSLYTSKAAACLRQAGKTAALQI